jgi:hypothetical protein
MAEDEKKMDYSMECSQSGKEYGALMKTSVQAERPVNGLQDAFACSVSAGEKESLEKKVANIGNNGNILSRAKYWVGRLTGKTPDDRINEYNRELRQASDEISGYINQRESELQKMEGEKAKLDRIVDAARYEIPLRIELRKDLKVKHDEVCGLITSFSLLEGDRLDGVFREYGPSIRDEKRLSNNQKRLKLKEALVDAKQKIELRSRNQTRIIGGLKHEYRRARAKSAAKQEKIDNCEHDIKYLMNAHLRIEEKILQLDIHSEPDSDTMKKADGRIRYVTNRVNEQLADRVNHCDLKNLEIAEKNVGLEIFDLDIPSFGLSARTEANERIDEEYLMNEAETDEMLEKDGVLK